MGWPTLLLDWMMPSDDEFPQTLCNCLALRQASRHVTQFYDQALAPSGIRTTQYSILHRVHAQGPKTVNELAEQLVMDPSTLTHNLRPLLKEGLVVLQVGTDRRRRAVALTPQGQATHRRARVLWLRAQAEFERVFGSTEAAALRQTMQNIVRTALANGESRPPKPARKRRE
ncbi:MarR family winged helix-turn-helix transcriptional regulator [Stigmatella sp. ncwal1]|uniref:MarR family winged helix-turn-helix transcriptional regulator n=1 Tax=Stigmatella ashevillensis TaxID=2995309 RepID=A0ABT5DR63_9BACT|nr:MarR family winged helix-turn-helix transcriptional regulator [Stigmatella ashevillena]MDC0714871.1 MarR family winged helix-turn-helix transcriptional regulator [Stigmatella ashevillena]